MLIDQRRYGNSETKEWTIKISNGKTGKMKVGNSTVGVNDPSEISDTKLRK